MKFYTSDLHLSHSNVIAFENRPFSDVEAMNQALLSNWNSRISDEDEIYVLGDFAFCGGSETNELLRQLNGQKFLIRGNHDRFIDDKGFDPDLFRWIQPYATIKDSGKVVVLFHYPIAVWDRQQYGSIHLYGHIHAPKASHHPLQIALQNAYNVGVDVCDFEPKTLCELMGEAQER